MSSPKEVPSHQIQSFQKHARHCRMALRQQKSSDFHSVALLLFHINTFRKYQRPASISYMERLKKGFEQTKNIRRHGYVLCVNFQKRGRPRACLAFPRSPSTIPKTCQHRLYAQKQTGSFCMICYETLVLSTMCSSLRQSLQFKNKKVVVHGVSEHLLCSLPKDAFDPPMIERADTRVT